MASSDDGGSHRPIVVAVDKDKNSASAVKWAVDNLLTTNPNLVLLHVRIKKSPNRRYPFSLIPIPQLSPKGSIIWYSNCIYIIRNLSLFIAPIKKAARST